jgi:hypothetical protein
MRSLFAPACAALVVALSASPAAAKLLIEIDKASQSMTVTQDGARVYHWPVSTGVRAYDTPGGQFTPFRLEKTHFSKEWDDAPMPNSIFFTQRGHAIHGTNHTSIGRPASHGCVRLSVEHSRMLFDLVKREGMANTKIVLAGALPAGGPAMARTPQPDETPRAAGYDRQPAYVQPRGYQDEAPYETQYERRAPVYREVPRQGYWLVYPNGERVYVDGNDPRLQPRPRYYRETPYGWQ